MLTKKKIHHLKTGEFTFEIESNVAEIDSYLQTYYQQERLMDNQGNFIDFHVSLTHSYGYRQFIKPQVYFSFNHNTFFNPLPISQAHLALEWGLNWVIATQAHQYLVIHAASLEKEGKGLIIAAPSGSGKSTLCAYLVSQGWQLLSDEHALVHRETLKMHAISRPINLKNQSIDLIKPLYSNKNISLPVENTHKGTISLLSVPETSKEPVRPRLLVFVQYDKDEELFIERVDKASALVEVIKNSFNFAQLNTEGFKCARRLVEQCNAYYVEYSNLAACEQVLTKHLQGVAKYENIS